MEGVSFGSALRELRTAKGLSLRYFALQLGVSATYVSQIERDRLPPPADEMIWHMVHTLGKEEFLHELLKLTGAPRKFSQVEMDTICYALACLAGEDPDRCPDRILAPEGIELLVARLRNDGYGCD